MEPSLIEIAPTGKGTVPEKAWSGSSIWIFDRSGFSTWIFDTTWIFDLTNGSRLTKMLPKQKFGFL